MYYKKRGGMKLSGGLKSTGIVLAVAAIAGCTSLNSRVGGVFNMDTDLVLRFKTDADVNPDDKKRPSPVFIRLYELKSTKQFARANFIDLYERDGEVLGADMVAKQTLKRLKPGDERKDSLVLKPETRYVGLVAEFLQYRDAKFKIVIPVAHTNVFATSADVRLSGNNMTLAKDAPREEAAPEADKR